MGEYLRFGNLLGGHHAGHKVVVMCRVRVPLAGRQGPPHMSLNVVVRHAQAVEIDDAEVVLGGGGGVPCCQVVVSFMLPA